eukprot:71279_1
MAHALDQSNKLAMPLRRCIDNVDNNASIYVNIQAPPNNHNRKTWLCAGCTVLLIISLGVTSYLLWTSHIFMPNDSSITSSPTASPTSSPTKSPTSRPTASPTYHPTPTPTKPPSIFGGMYSTGVNKVYSVNNYYTNDQSCPINYSPHHVAYFLACYRCGGVNLYLCLKDGLQSDPRQFFGGVYNTNGCGGVQFVNPLTGDFSCDTTQGYQSHLIIATQTDGYCN